jgi:lipopolysaccharide/colanic/teichoic acid biosynthesis glycosyltransferase
VSHGDANPIINKPRLGEEALKRGLDVLGSIAGLTIFLPTIPFIILGVKLTSPGPLLFKQSRSGKGGKRFVILKFRSMVDRAEERRGELINQYKNTLKGPIFKLEDDPRITPFGKFLRCWSLDEIPQFLNVLLGDMSLVGPRPLPDYETSQMDPELVKKRLSVKPGITCTWQSEGRHDIKEFADWMKMDLDYIETQSFLLDIKILLKTIPAVLQRTGAH